ncbi:MAG: hypothetical protein KAR20_25040 [Candidatus Heimdallarchaeota archaeon]|nr:hypothetical protein [Candidatus Heimdallarchaeota archaeon]
MGKVYLATRIEKGDFEKIQKLVSQSKLGKAEIARRLIIIGLKQVKKPEDLIKL